jgi:hypothetical protein
MEQFQFTTPSGVEVKTRKTVYIEFKLAEDAKSVVGRHDGKIALVDFNYRGILPQHLETWECYIKREEDKKMIVIPKQCTVSSEEAAAELADSIEVLASKKEEKLSGTAKEKLQQSHTLENNVIVKKQTRKKRA